MRASEYKHAGRLPSIDCKSWGVSWTRRSCNEVMAMSVLFIVGAVIVLGALSVFGFLVFSRDHEHDCTEPRYLADRRDPMRRWFHGALAVYRGDCGDPGYWDRSCAVHQLSCWSCKQPADVMELINEYQSGETTTAFDKLRIIWLARAAEGAGWMSPEQSWRWCEQAKAALLTTYRDWESVAIDTVAGRAEWYGGDIPDDQRKSTDESLAFAKRHVLPLVPFRG